MAFLTCAEPLSVTKGVEMKQMRNRRCERFTNKFAHDLRACLVANKQQRRLLTCAKIQEKSELLCLVEQTQ